jgi:hypothetical protein
MTPLSAITDLTPEVADLLAAAGIGSVEALAAGDTLTLHRQLELVAWKRGRSNSAPAPERVEHWLAVARMLAPDVKTAPVNVDDLPEAVVHDVEPAPLAPAAWMPPSVRAAAEATGVSRPEIDTDAVRRESSAAENSWRKVDPSSFATIEDYNEGRISVQPLSREPMGSAPAVDPDSGGEVPRRRSQRIRSTGEQLSRWVRRGVVHPRPFHTWLGAVISLLWRAGFVTGLAALIWLITVAPQPSDHTTTVIVCFVILLVLGFLQMHFAWRSRCRICSCNLFYSKNCHKNRKAHLIHGFGYVASAALHLLTFGWFRCMYCGTAIRLRPGKDR